MASELSHSKSLLLCCARTRASESELAHIRSLVSAGVQWRNLLALANEHRVLPLLDINLRRAGVPLPPDVDDNLRYRHHATAADNLGAALVATHLTALFAKASIPCLCLKGPSLAIAAYGELSLRQFSDLDLLVRESDLHPALDILLREGWMRTHDEFSNPGAYHLSLVEPAKAKPVVIELHWQLSREFYAFDLNPRVWSNPRTITAGDIAICALPVEEEFLFLCVHGSKHYWERLAWISDIAQHIAAHPDLDWERLFQLAISAGRRRMLLLGLALADTPLPSLISAQLDREKFLTAQTARLRLRLFDDTHPLVGTQTRLRGLLYALLIHERLRDRIRLCLRYTPQLAPTPRDRSAIPLPKGLGWLYFVIRPIRLLAAYGPQLLSFLMNRNKSI